MSRKNKNPNRAGFLNTVDNIRNAENDVDLVLKAGRLKRHESSREPLKPRHIVAIVAAVCLMIICCMFLVFGYLSGDMGMAMFGVLIVFVFAVIGALCTMM